MRNSKIDTNKAEAFSGQTDKEMQSWCLYIACVADIWTDASDDKRPKDKVNDVTEGKEANDHPRCEKKYDCVKRLFGQVRTFCGTATYSYNPGRKK